MFGRGYRSLFQTRWLFANNEIYKAIVLNSRNQGVSGKETTIFTNHGAEHP